MRNKEDIKMSVVIVAHDRYESIRLAMTYLAAQTIAASLEIVIAAPAREQLGLIEAEMRPFHSYRLVEVGEVKRRGVAAAQAIRQAHGPIVVLTENHAFPDRDWAEILVAAHDGPWAGVCPEVAGFNPRTWTSRAQQLLIYSYWQAHTEPGEIDRLPWHNSSYKRDLLMQFDEELEDLFTVEQLIQGRLRAQGHRFYIAARAKTRHVNDSKLTAACLTRFTGGRLFAASRSRHWRLVRKLIYVMASPLFPVIRLVQLRENYVRYNRRRSALPLMPHVVLLLTASAVGECVGYLFGPGAVRDTISRHDLVLETRVNRRELEEMRALLQKRLAVS